MKNPTLDSVSQGIEPYQMPSSGSAFGATVHQHLTATGGSVTIAGSANADSVNAGAANDIYSSSADFWGSFASDRKKKEGKK
jgi:hypothetical protein